jgi:hypothetical protein
MAAPGWFKDFSSGIQRSAVALASSLEKQGRIEEGLL